MGTKELNPQVGDGMEAGAKEAPPAYLRLVPPRPAPPRSELLCTHSLFFVYIYVINKLYYTY